MKFIHKETEVFTTFPKIDAVSLACPACLLYTKLSVNDITLCEHCRTEIFVSLKAQTICKEEE